MQQNGLPSLLARAQHAAPLQVRDTNMTDGKGKGRGVPRPYMIACFASDAGR